MIELLFTLLLFFGLGILGVFLFAVMMQKKMAKDYAEKKDLRKMTTRSDDWGRGDGD